MNATRIIHTFTRLACCLLAGALASCIADDLVSPASPETPLSPGLHLNLQVNGETTISTRSAGVDALNENLIKTADVFIFNPDETLNKHAHADNVGSNGTVTVYSGSDWLKNFAQGNSYGVYVIANYKGDGTTDLANIADLDGLKALVAADPEIVYWEGMNKNTTPGSTTDEMKGKTFLMDGHETVTYGQLAEAAERGTICTLPVSLYRAAVKVEMTLNFSEAWRKVFQPTGLRIQVANYATRTPAIAGGNPLDPDQRGFQTTPAYGEGTTTKVEEAFSENFISARDDNNDWEGSTVRFYAYINRWDDLVENETMLLIDLPGYYKENPDDEGMGEYNLHNFYKVPIIANAETQAMQRNTFYQINATADMLGTSTIDQPVELTNVQFKTAPWIEDETVVVGGDDDPSFLILSDYHKIIRDADGFDDLGFYSSSPVKVTLAGFDSQAAATAAGIDFTYPGNGNAIPAVYFVDKDNNKRSTNIVGNDNLTWNENATSGTISLTSPTPTNVTKRYITLKVTNGTDTKYVVVEQYPLEYIQPIQGYYSYRDDFLSEGVDPEGVPCHWGMRFNKKGSGWFPDADDNMPTNGEGFSSKVYNSADGYIYQYRFTDGGFIIGGNDYYEAERYSNQGTTNNNMYFVTITQTSNEYKIAHPLLDNNGYTVSTSENTELVSPMFMLASRLGTVTPMSYSNAQRHCANYVEVTMDGEHKLDDWRLPTGKELEIIEAYQVTTPDVMDEVLALDQTDYWGAGGYFTTRNGRNSITPGSWNSGTNGTRYIRCIRDVKPDDVFLQTNNE